MVTVQVSGALRPAGLPGPQKVRAATVQEAADTAGLPAGRPVTAMLNNDQVTSDPWTPLATGDTVFLAPADAGG
jgi:molybdopterin converting factor small subunit